MKKFLLALSFLSLTSLYSNEDETTSLDAYLNKHGFQLSPLHSEINEGYMTDAQKQQFALRLQQFPHIQKVVEIGLNGGHSAENFFINCPELKKFLSFDINYHAYTQKAADYFLLKYKDKFEFIVGDSLVKVPEYTALFPDEKFDLIYIDANHTYEHCLIDIINCKKLSHSDSIVWIDDYNHGSIQSAVAFLRQNKLIEIIEVHTSHDKNGGRCWVEVRYL